MAPAQNHDKARTATERPASSELDRVAVIGEIVERGRAGLPVSTFRGPVGFGPLTLYCHVLGDGTCIVAGGDIEQLFFTAKTGDLGRSIARIFKGRDGLTLPPTIEFRVPGIGPSLHGYNADVVIDIANAIVDLALAGTLHHKQRPLLAQARAIQSACGKAGITGVIWEGTGARQHMGERSLQDKLAAVLMEEAGEYRTLFRREFFLELAKLYRLELTSPNRRPGCFASFIGEFVYAGLDRDVAAKLRELNPHPTLGVQHHRYLTKFGRERVERHLRDVVILMRSSTDIDDFRMQFARVFKGGMLQTAWKWAH